MHNPMHFVVVFENSCVLSFEESEDKARARVEFFRTDGYTARYDRIAGPMPVRVEEAARAYESLLAERANNVVHLFGPLPQDIERIASDSGFFPPAGRL